MTNREKKLEMNKNRTPEFQRNASLEKVLSEVNNLIENIDTPSYSIPRYPVIFIMGCPRSGSTLFLQWLASLKLFSYPSNLIARFYKNPYLGARIQQILIDYDKIRQINIGSTDKFFDSKLGKTWGALSPSEFWYFWRRFFKFGKIQYLEKKAFQKINYKRFLQDIAGLEMAFDKPVVMKGMILNWHIPYLTKLFQKKCLFIHVKREPIFTAQSLYLGRLKFFADEKRWFSYKPPEYSFLKDMSPLAQVAGQVYYTTRAVERGLKTLEPYQFIEIDYEKFCKNPHKFYRILIKHLELFKFNIEKKYVGPKSFDINNQKRLKTNQLKKIGKYYKFFIENKK